MRLEYVYTPKGIWGLADVRIDERTSALGHINLNSLRVHREHIIGLAPFGGGKPHILSPRGFDALVAGWIIYKGEDINVLRL